MRDPIEKERPVVEKGRVVGYQTVVEDAGITDKRLVVIETEFASTLKVMAREGNTLSPVMRQAWDGHDLRTLTKGSPACATAPHISFIGHITSQELTRYLEADRNRQRIRESFPLGLFEALKELPDGGLPVDLAGSIGRLAQAVDHARHTGELRRDETAGRRWHQVYGALSAGRPGMLAHDRPSRGTGDADRLPLRPWGFVGGRQVGAPPGRTQVWRYAYRSAAYLFGDRLGDRTADAILTHLRRHTPESVTRSEITRDLFGRNRPASEIDRALALLTEHKLVRSEQDRSGDGRPIERWWAAQPDDINDIYDITPTDEADDPPFVVNVVNVVTPTATRGRHSTPENPDRDAGWKQADARFKAGWK